MGYGISIRIETPFAEGAARVHDALKAQGFGVLTEIDVRATLRDKLGQDMPRSRGNRMYLMERSSPVSIRSSGKIASTRALSGFSIISSAS